MQNFEPFQGVVPGLFLPEPWCLYAIKYLLSGNIEADFCADRGLHSRSFRGGRMDPKFSMFARSGDGLLKTSRSSKLYSGGEYRNGLSEIITIPVLSIILPAGVILFPT